MVRQVSGRYERLGARYGRWVVLGLGILVGAAVLTWFLTSRSFWSLPRLSVVVVTDPMVVLSWDSAGRFAVIRLPSDTTVEAVRGYGTYSLAALWQLGDIHPSERGLLADSLQQILAIPIPWYLGQRGGKLPAWEGENLALLRDSFSLRRLPAFLPGRLRTNLPLPVYLWLWKTLLAIKSDQVNVYDAVKMTAINLQELPDGTSVKVFDGLQFDTQVGNALENERVRREHISVAVYNTTDTPELGERAGRLLGRLGALVVTVGNDKPTVERCRLNGNQSVLSSRTAAAIVSLFGCEKYVSQAEERADILLRLGRDYERLFAPVAGR